MNNVGSLIRDIYIVNLLVVDMIVETSMLVKQFSLKLIYY